MFGWDSGNPYFCAINSFNLNHNMNKKVFIFIMSMLMSCACVWAQQKSNLHQRAEQDAANGKPISARALWIMAYRDYVSKGQISQGVECAVKATPLYYNENFYNEAFDLLRSAEQAITNSKQSNAVKASLRYAVNKERMAMYMKMRKGERVKDWVEQMEKDANESGDENLKNDYLYHKAIYYYTFGQTAKGNEVVKDMTVKMTAAEDYEKMDDVFKTLIAGGRRSGNANMVSQAYDNYIAWKDSASAKILAEETGALKKQIADYEEIIEEKDSTLTVRQGIIVGLGILAVVLAVVLVLGALVLLRFIALTRKQKKNIARLNENNALKASFISNISAQLTPTLQRLDAQRPEVKALMDFSDHIQTLSQLETTIEEPVEVEEVQLASFCEGIMNQVRGQLQSGVEATVDAPKMSASINKEYVSHILLHLLRNAMEYTPVGGHIVLAFKKRGAHKLQFLVSNTGSNIPEEKREDVFKPFLDVKDLTTGDGLGLPICKQMAIKMNGDLNIDPEFTKGVRFILHLQG